MNEEVYMYNALLNCGAIKKKNVNKCDRNLSTKFATATTFIYTVCKQNNDWISVHTCH